MLPRINDTLYFQIASSDEEESQVVYRSRIADEDADSLYIEIPIQENSGKLKKLYIGDELSSYLMNSEGVKHYFNTYVLGYREDIIRLVRIRKAEPGSMTRIQRRNFLRVPAELELAISIKGQVRFIAVTDDISGGGISFVANGNEPVEMGLELECWMLVPYKNGAVDHSFFKGEVVRVERLENGKKQGMLKFKSISEPDRQRIIRYCFERQLDYRK